MPLIRPALCLVALLSQLALVACETAPVTGRRQIVLVSDGQAAQMGVNAYQQIKSETRVSRDRQANRIVTQIGQRIAAVSGQPNLPWEFTVFEDSNPNAFALPGGKVGVNTGLFKVVKNQHQLAAVMAHEVAHVLARHSAERVSHQVLLQAGLVGAQALSGPESQQWMGLAAQAATLGVILPYSRTQESEADEIGLTYMARAGYDPRAAVDVWRNFQAFGGNRPPEFLSTHPAPASRIQRIQEKLPGPLQIYLNNPNKVQKPPKRACRTQSSETSARPSIRMMVCRPLAQSLARPVLVRPDLEIAEGQGPARTKHPAERRQSLAIGRRHQVDLVFDRQHGRVRRKQAEGRIAAGGVGDRAGDAGMEEAVLLCQVVAEGQLDLDLAGRDARQASADQAHDALALEAALHAGLEVRVRRFELAHRSPPAARVGPPSASSSASRCRQPWATPSRCWIAASISCRFCSRSAPLISIRCSRV